MCFTYDFQSLNQGIFDVLDVNEAAADEAVGTTPVMTPGLDKCKRLHQGVKGIRYLQFYGKHINAEFKVDTTYGAKCSANDATAVATSV